MISFKKSSLSINNSKKVIIMRTIRMVGTIFCLFGIIIASYKIIRAQVERDIAADQITMVQQTISGEMTDSDQTEIIETDTPAKEDPYWDFIKMSLLDVKLDDLIAINPETVGWIKVEGTNINYPFVQSSDNEYYLEHTFNRSWNSAGWVFLDYRNNPHIIQNRNTIIYAHGRFDGSMFGTLQNTLKSQWQENPNNYTIKTSTASEDSLWQVFSVYRIPTTSDYLKTDFVADNEFQVFAQMLKNRSAFDLQTNISPSDKIITLSTCIGNNDERMVLHAKLIKTTPKV